jgi:VWFA-related protein
VGTLSREDFELYEDGVKQDITYFSQDKLPLSIVMLFDLTDTVRPVLKPLARGALEALNHLKPEDEVAVMTYSASAQLIQDFTTDRSRIAAAIDRAGNMKSDEAAFFNEGVYQAAKHTLRSRNPNSRPVIIWLTDNVPNTPSQGTREWAGKSLDGLVLHTEKDAFNELFESGSVVSVLLEKSTLSKLANILFNKNPIFSSSRHKYPPGDVYHYSGETGGEVMGSSKEEVAGKLAMMIDHLRTRYSLGYHPSVDQTVGKFCKIKLVLNPRIEKREGKVLVRARTGYYRGLGRRSQPK